MWFTTSSPSTGKSKIKMSKLTHRERIVLTYLRSIDKTTATALGKEIHNQYPKMNRGRVPSKRNYSYTGVAVLRNLLKRELVELVEERTSRDGGGLWSLTTLGRDTLRLSK